MVIFNSYVKLPEGISAAHMDQRDMDYKYKPMLSNWCFASGLYHVVSMNWKIDYANIRKSLFPIYICIYI